MALSYTRHNIHDQYIRAHSDSQLSSSQTQLLSNLLSEEDQHDYNQILNIQLSQQIIQIVTQVRYSSFLPLSVIVFNLSFNSIF